MLSIIDNLEKLFNKYRMQEKVILINNLKKGDKILKLLSCSNYINLTTKKIEDIATESIKHILIKDNKEIISEIKCMNIIKKILKNLKQNNQLKYFKDIILEVESEEGKFKDLLIDNEIAKLFYNLMIELKLEKVDLKLTDKFYENNKLIDIDTILKIYNEELKNQNYLDKADVHILALENGNLDKQKNKKYINLYDETISKVELEILDKIMEKNSDEIKITSNNTIENILEKIKIRTEKDADYINLFRGYGESNELYEIVRKIKEISQSKSESPIKFEDIAIYHTDDEKYTHRMYELSQLMDIPVKFEEGISISYKKEANLIYKLVEWVKSDYRDDILYELVNYLYLEDGISQHDIQNMLNKFNIGFGKERYKKVISKQIEELNKKIKELNDERQEQVEKFKDENYKNIKSIADKLINNCKNNKIKLEEVIECLNDVLKIFKLKKDDNIFKILKELKGKESISDKKQLLSEYGISIENENKIVLIYELIKWIKSGYNDKLLCNLKKELQDTNSNIKDIQDDIKKSEDELNKLLLNIEKIKKLHRYKEDLKKTKLFKSIIDKLIDNIPDKKTTYSEVIENLKDILEEFKSKNEKSYSKVILEAIDELKNIEEMLDVNKILQHIENEIKYIKINEDTGSDEEGRVYFTYYKNGYYNDRKYHFIIGLDNNKFPNKIHQNPILLDDERENINKTNNLNLNLAEKIPYKEKLEMADLIYTRKGKVFISYCGFDFKDNAINEPSHLFLELARIVYDKPTLNYEQLNTELGKMNGFADNNLNRCLSKTEQWLSQHLAGKTVTIDYLDNTSKFNELQNICKAIKSKEDKDTFDTYCGNVGVDDLLKVTDDENKSMSVTQMKDFITCPYKYFLKRVLNINAYKHKPRTLEYECWLKPNEFGTLMHEVFETFYKDIIHKNETLNKLDFSNYEKLIHEILYNKIEEAKLEYPFLNKIVYDDTIKRINFTCDNFLEKEISEKKKNKRLSTECVEYEFGNEENKVAINLNNKKIYINGKIDRIDKISKSKRKVKNEENNKDEYIIIDYKSGKGKDHTKKRVKEDEERDDLNKGKNIQNIIYAMAIKDLLLKDSEDAKLEQTKYYLLNNEYKNIQRKKLSVDKKNIDNCKAILEEMVHLIEKGYFIKCYSKDKSNDSCKYCEYKNICQFEYDKKNKIKNLYKLKDENIKGRLAFYE